MTGRPRWATVVVLVIGLALVAAAVAGVVWSNGQTEQHLLEEHTAEATAVLTAAVSGIQTPLAAAAELAELTEGDPRTFSTVMGRVVGEDRQFTSAAIFERGDPEPIAVLGDEPVIIGAGADRVRAMLEQATATDDLSLIDVLAERPRRLGYAFVSFQPTPRFVVYAESALPDEALSVPRATGAFAQLDYALYIEDRAEARLLYASVGSVPIEGRRAEASIEFGDSALVFVATPAEHLGGGLSRILPWLVGVVGVLIALTAAAVTEWLVRRRDRAEALAADVSRLYDEQRYVAQTLQRGLLPRTLVPPPGMAVAGRYWPADSEIEVGGDFYDLFPLDDGRWVFAIGDVCGKGVEAAALTGVTRHTIRAAARHVQSPARVLAWVHDAIAAYSGTTYSTVCVGVLSAGDDPDGPRHVTVALGGHPHPLLCRADGTVESIGRSGTLLGMIEPALFDEVHDLERGDTLVLYTDGITDAPNGGGVPVDRLHQVVAEHRTATPDEMAEEIRREIERHRPHGSGDDTALLVIRNS